MTDPQTRRQFWQSHLQRSRELGMTLKAYAEQEGLKLSVFYSWSKRLNKVEDTAAGHARVELKGLNATPYRLHLPSGLVLKWQGQADAEQLARLVKHLA